jgi:hypothetical protein
MAAFFSDATTPQREKDHTPENRDSRSTFQSIVDHVDGTGSGAATIICQTNSSLQSLNKSVILHR